jgi:hypothetical protein
VGVNPDETVNIVVLDIVTELEGVMVFDTVVEEDELTEIEDE